jgi:hypothetical protein
MTLIDRNGILAGLALGIPFTLFKNPEAPVTEHFFYVLGVVVFCWAVARLFGGRSTRS